MTRVLIRTCPWDPERLSWALDLAAGLTEPTLVRDEVRDGYDTFLRALEEQGNHDAWHLEDDAILTTGFEAKARWLEQLRPGVLIQGFSRRHEDETIGARWAPPSTFGNNVCFFLPGGLAGPMLDYLSAWPDREVNPTAYDTAMRQWMVRHRERYWVAVPNLADHREGNPSLIGGPGRGRRRSRSFVP